MKEIKMFILKNCPYCKKALGFLEKYPFDQDVKVEIIDEAANPELAGSYDYYYVPCFYLNEVKLHEGAINEDDYRKMVREVSAK